MWFSIPRYRDFGGTDLPDNPAFLYDLAKVNKVFFSILITKYSYIC